MVLMYIFNKYICVSDRELYLGILYGQVIITFSPKLFNYEEGLPYSHVRTHRYCTNVCYTDKYILFYNELMVFLIIMYQL